MIICAKSGKNPSRDVHAVEQTLQDVPYFGSFIANPWLNDLEDIGQDHEVIVQDTPSYASDHLVQILKNPSRAVHAVELTRQDVTYFSSSIAKSWLNDLEHICQGQGSLYTTHDSMIVIICAKYRKNPSRTVCNVEQTPQDVTYLSSFIAK